MSPVNSEKPEGTSTRRVCCAHDTPGCAQGWGVRRGRWLNALLVTAKAAGRLVSRDGRPSSSSRVTTALTIAVIAAGCGSEGRPKSPGRQRPRRLRTSRAASQSAHRSLSSFVAMRSPSRCSSRTWASSVQEIAACAVHDRDSLGPRKTVAGASACRQRSGCASRRSCDGHRAQAANRWVVTENLYLAYLTPFTFDETDQLFSLFARLGGRIRPPSERGSRAVKRWCCRRWWALRAGPGAVFGVV